MGTLRKKGTYSGSSHGEDPCSRGDWSIAFASLSQITSLSSLEVQAEVNI
jgi:hypothetical protein